MPEYKDIEAIEKMLLELGETELELGEINEHEYLTQHKLGAGTPEIMDAEEAEPVLPGEAAAGEEAVPSGEPVATGDEEDFQELLKDIEIGLTEERELQEKLAAEEETPPDQEIEPVEEIPITEALLPDREDLQPEEALAAAPEEPSTIEAIPGLEELLGEGAPAAQPEEPAEQFEEPVFPEELLQQFPETAVPEEPTEQLPEPFVPEEPSIELDEAEPTPEVEVPLPEEETLPAEQVPEAIDEGALDLPVDFDMADMASTERPPFAEGAIQEEAGESRAEEVVPETEREEIVETQEEAIPSAPREESISIEEPTVELEDLLFQEPEEEQDEPTAEETLEKAIIEAPAAEEAAETPAEISFEDLESMGMQEEPLSEGLPSIEEIGAEDIQAKEELEAGPEPQIEPVQEPAQGETAEQVIAEARETMEEEAAASDGEVMELTEEDIGRIKTKLSTMTPVVAAAVQDIIVKSSLPADSMNGIVELLILDAPEQEIVDFVERVTGRKIAVPPIRRPAPIVARKPGVLGALAENIGPFVRASMLVGAILVVLAALFFVFFWNPYNAGKYHRQALLSIEKNDWVQVEENLDEAASFQSKSPQFFHGIRQYDNLGWKLMLAGQFNLAEEVFVRGIRKELDKNQSIKGIKGVGNSRIFMRLAILFNLQGKYAESEELYAFILNDLRGLKSSLYETPEIHGAYQRPYIIRLFDGTDFIQKQKGSLREYRRAESEEDRLRKTDEVTLLIAERIATATSLSSTDTYDFRMLRGENLIDELAVDEGDSISEEERRDDIALAQFQKAAEIKRGEAAPLYKQLQVSIRRDDYAAVSSLTDQILRRFSKSRDEEVQTELARYLVEYENFTIVRQLLLGALNKRGMVYPYASAYVTYGDYYKAVGNKVLREEYLLSAVEAEQNRVLPNTWNFRDRKLVSWTDYRSQRLPVKSVAEQINEPQTDNAEFLFPWDRRDTALLSEAYNGLGEIYAQGESFENVARAIRYFRKAIDPDAGPRADEATFNPEVPEATFSLAQLYFYRVKDYSNALKLYRAYERAFEEHRLRMMDGSTYSPYVNDLYYNLGYLYYNQIKNNQSQNLTRALQYWSKLESLLPDNPHLQMAIGNTLLHKGAYESALGRYLYLAEVYDSLVDGLGEIKPWQDYDRRIIGEAAAVYNNLGVAYQKISERKPIDNYQRNSLVALYKAGEYADILGEDRGNIQYNIYYIIHPEVVRSDMKINDDLSDNYRFTVQ